MIFVYITVKDIEEARKISRALLEDKLCACTNMFPMKSMYMWEGSLEESDEYALIAKTRGKLFDKVVEKVRSAHSYEIPCILSWDIDRGNKEYIDWVEKETTPDSQR